MDQPGDEIRVLARESVPAAEAARVHRAQLRVVAAAPLGDVVEEGREVEQLGLAKVPDQPAAKRILMGEFLDRETAQVAHAPS